MERSSDSPSGSVNPSRRQLLRRAAGWTAVAALGLAACGRDDDRPWTGAVFPDFVLPGLDGTLHDSRADAGTPRLINFWATWCPPCRAEMADLDALRRRLGPQGLRLLAISVDEDANLVREYLRREGLGLRVLLDAGQRWSGPALRVPGFPATYLVGRDGRISDTRLGPRAWGHAAVQAEIAARLGLA